MSIPSLLGPSDAAPFTLVNTAGATPALIVCDHAGASVPSRLGSLGLPDARFNEHIAIDIGAEALSRRLSTLLDVPAVIATYSRLVMDLNRYPDDAASMPTVSDGVPIPGNAHLDAAAKAARRRALFDPYHEAIASELRRLDAVGHDGTPDNVPVSTPVISVHSFTPQMAGVSRPWEVGILSTNADRRVADPLLASLRELPGVVIGDNEPYSADQPLGYTTVEHCDRVRRRYALIEVRQDEIAQGAGVAKWADRLAASLKTVLEL